MSRPAHALTLPAGRGQNTAQGDARHALRRALGPAPGEHPGPDLGQPTGGGSMASASGRSGARAGEDPVRGRGGPGCRPGGAGREGGVPGAARSMGATHRLWYQGDRPRRPSWVPDAHSAFLERRRSLTKATARTKATDLSKGEEGEASPGTRGPARRETVEARSAARRGWPWSRHPNRCGGEGQGLRGVARGPRADVIHRPRAPTTGAPATGAPRREVARTVRRRSAGRRAADRVDALAPELRHAPAAQ